MNNVQIAATYFLSQIAKLEWAKKKIDEGYIRQCTHTTDWGCSVYIHEFFLNPIRISDHETGVYRTLEHYQVIVKDDNLFAVLADIDDLMEKYLSHEIFAAKKEAKLAVAKAKAEEKQKELDKKFADEFFALGIDFSNVEPCNLRNYLKKELRKRMNEGGFGYLQVLDKTLKLITKPKTHEI